MPAPSRFGSSRRRGALAALLAIAATAVGTSAPAAPVAGAAVLRGLPLSFEPNRGQLAPEARFVARGAGGALFLLPGETVLALGADAAPARSGDVGRRAGAPSTSHRVALRMRWRGARLDAPIVAEAPLPGRVNVVRGSDPTRWQLGIPTFARVRYPELYPGIDVVYYGRGAELEHDLVVAPGADASRVRLEILGADSVELDADGGLAIALAGRAVRLHAPVAYQEHDGERRAIASRYVLEAGGRVRLALGDYDRSRPLVIDPVLSYATYFGGNAEDNGGGIHADASGIVIGGNAASTDLPGAQNANAGGADAFVAKFDPTGASLLYASYFGGGGDETQRGLVVDALGDAYLFGETTSTDLPTTQGAFDRSCGVDGFCDGGKPDTFVVKFDGSDGTPLYATYLGGSGSEIAGKIAVDANRNAYVAGYTNSTDLPVTQGVYDPTCGTDGTCNNVVRDCFVAKLDVSGGSLAYLTYLGGSGFDRCFGIDVDGNGRAVVVGSTLSPDFPATAGAYDASCGSDGQCDGGDDAFAAMLDANGAGLVYATFLGGSGDGDADIEEYGWAVDADASGRAWIVGQTDSSDFPTPNGARAFSGGGIDAFVARLDATGSSLLYATYLGGAGTEQGFGIAVEPGGAVHVTGVTDSSDFPQVAALAGPGNACANCPVGLTEVFVATLAAGDGSLEFSSFLGGSSADYGADVAIGGAGSFYVLGDTYSSDFPTRDPYQAAHGIGENYDVFVARLPEPGAPLLELASALALAQFARRRRIGARWLRFRR